MDYKSIQALIQTMSDSALTSLEIESEGIRIKMKKETEKIFIEKTVEVVRQSTEAKGNMVEVVKPQGVIETTGQMAKEEIKIETKESEATKDSSDFIVTSPIVGTFYGASGPTSKDFVEVGTKIKIGDTLCIVEAMKLMNEIESEVEGEILEILVKNEQMVQYGQPLFRVKVI